MSRNSKSKDYNLNSNFVELKDEFFRCYDALKHYDAECVRLNDDADRGDYSWSTAQSMIDEIEQLQRELVSHMLAIKTILRIQDRTIDAYLWHLVYVLGL